MSVGGGKLLNLSYEYDGKGNILSMEERRGDKRGVASLWSTILCIVW